MSNTSEFYCKLLKIARNFAELRGIARNLRIVACNCAELRLETLILGNRVHTLQDGCIYVLISYFRYGVSGVSVYNG